MSRCYVVSMFYWFILIDHWYMVELQNLLISLCPCCYHSFCCCSWSYSLLAVFFNFLEIYVVSMFYWFILIDHWYMVELKTFWFLSVLVAIILFGVVPGLIHFLLFFFNFLESPLCISKDKAFLSFAAIYRMAKSQHHWHRFFIPEGDRMQTVSEWNCQHKWSGSKSLIKFLSRDPMKLLFHQNSLLLGDQFGAHILAGSWSLFCKWFTNPYVLILITFAKLCTKFYFFIWFIYISSILFQCIVPVQ